MNGLFLSMNRSELGRAFFLHCIVIDIICYILVILAIIQGWRKGLIIALFSLICGLIGLAAAVKLSAVVAMHMKSDLNISNRWLPVIAFIFVFVAVLIIIRLTGRLLEKILKLVLLEWLNKLGGILLFMVLYLSIYSVILFYGTETHIITKKAVEDSTMYSMIAPFGPAIIRFITGFLPFGKDMFDALEGFFGKMASRIN